MFEETMYEGKGDLAVKDWMKLRQYLQAVARPSHGNSMRRNDAPGSLAGRTTGSWKSRCWNPQHLIPSLGTTFHTTGTRACLMTEGKDRWRLVEDAGGAVVCFFSFK